MDRHGKYTKILVVSLNLKNPFYYVPFKMGGR